MAQQHIIGQKVGWT